MVDQNEKILLLSCCAPCSCAVIKTLAEKQANFAVVFYNPNIRPQAEYIKRRDENKRVCRLYGIDFIELEYDNDRWCRLTKGLENEPERGKRCSVCFEMRLKRVMEYAQANGFTAVASVLGVSRWKNLMQVNEAAARAAAKTNAVYVHIEGRKNGMQELRAQLIKELNLYNQTYCGCKPPDKKEKTMLKIIPNKLQKGDKIMVVAPSRGLKLIGQDCREIALQRFRDMGLNVVFAPNTTDENWNEQGCGSIEQRAADIMTAFSDPSVKAIFTVIGGFNSNQILQHLDYEIIKKNPKIICGFSDITALLDAIHSQTGLEVYYGPHFSSIGMAFGCEYTLSYLQKILFTDDEFEVIAAENWSDDLWFLDQQKRTFIKNDGFWNIHNGRAEGTIVGGNLCTFNLLLGTPYRPPFVPNTILFIEDDGSSSAMVFDRNLQALCHQPDFANVAALVIGRFQKSSEITRPMLEFIINNKPELKNLPVLANVDYGHSTPIITIPLGGTARLENGRLWLKK